MGIFLGDLSCKCNHRCNFNFATFALKINIIINKLVT